MNKLYFIAVFLISLISFSSCSKTSDNEESKEMKLEFITYSYDLIAQDSINFVKEDDIYSYRNVRGTAILPVKVGGNDITELLDSLTKISSIIRIDKKVVEPVLEDGFLITDKSPKEFDACSIQTNDLSIDLVTPHLLVWKDYSYLNLCGSAHGEYSTIYINYSIDESRVLKLDDIFTPAGKEELKNLIRERLIEEKVSLLVEPDEVNVSDNFRLTANSIEFIYPLYSIAPYNEGEIDVEFQINEIESTFIQGMEEILYGNSY